MMKEQHQQIPPGVAPLRYASTNDNFILRVVFQENNTSSRAIVSRADYIERLKRAKGYLCNG